MSKLSIFDSILNCSLRPNDQSLMVEENTDNFGNLFSMKSKIVPGRVNYLLYRFDHNRRDIFPFFSDRSGLKKMCDYILFAEENQSLYIFLIELKYGRLSARKQLHAGKAFATYIVESAKRIGRNLEDENIFIRSVRICHANWKKKKTGQKFAQYDGDGFLDYEHQDFRLKYLMN